MVIVIALVVGGVAAVAPGIALLGGSFLFPSLCSLILEQASGWPRTRAMALFGFAAALIPFRNELAEGGDLDTLLTAATDPAVIAKCWAAQATAWSLSELASAALIAYAAWTTGRDLQRMEHARARLQEEWSA